MFKSLRPSDITLYLILLAIVLGFGLGHYKPSVALKIGFLGDVFLNALFMLVVPLVVASMVTGIARLRNLKELGSLGTRTLVYYLSTTAISVIIGIILVNIIQPGKGVPRVQDVHPEAAYRIQPTPLRGGSVLHLVDDDDRFYGTEYNSRFVIELLDQNVCGIIDETSCIGEKDIPVSYWIDDRGKKVEPETEGFGVQIKLAEREFSFLSVLIGLIAKTFLPPWPTTTSFR